MAQTHPLAQPASLLLGAAALVLAACGGRVALPVPDCNAEAVAYCQANGCPLTGPSASTQAAVGSWCGGSPAFASRVTGFGTCTAPGGKPWANDVQATDPSGATLYLLYDPSTNELLSVSTVGAGDGGKVEHDYGTCGEHTGIVTCATASYLCAR